MKSEEAKDLAEKVLVCFALKEEAGPFCKFLANRSNVTILFTGIGKKNAENAVRKFLEHNSPDLVLTCGFAGALKPDLILGAVLFATEDDGLGKRVEKAGATSAKFFCANRMAITETEKKKIYRESGADAVEMESEAIQFVCREKRIPSATLRVISDTAEEDLPLDFNELSKPDLNLHYGKLAWAIAKSPRKIGALLRLQKRCRFAAEQLAKVLLKIISP